MISPIAAAAAVTVVTSANAALVVIGTGAKISSRGDLSITAYAQDNFSTSAIAEAVLEDKNAYRRREQPAGVRRRRRVATTTNDASVQVGDGVSLNAAGDLTISAQAVRPNQLTIRDLNLRLPIGPSDNPPQPTIGGSTALDVAGSILTALQQWTNYQSDTFTQAPLYLFLLLWPLREAMGVVPAIKTTSTVAATGGGTRTGSDGTETGRTSFALTGSVIVLTLTNTASATVGQQRPAEHGAGCRLRRHGGGRSADRHHRKHQPGHGRFRRPGEARQALAVQPRRERHRQHRGRRGVPTDHRHHRRRCPRRDRLDPDRDGRGQRQRRQPHG